MTGGKIVLVPIGPMSDDLLAWPAERLAEGLEKEQAVHDKEEGDMSARTAIDEFPELSDARDTMMALDMDQVSISAVVAEGRR